MFIISTGLQRPARLPAAQQLVQNGYSWAEAWRLVDGKQVRGKYLDEAQEREPDPPYCTVGGYRYAL